MVLRKEKRFVAGKEHLFFVFTVIRFQQAGREPLLVDILYEWFETHFNGVS